MQVLSSSNQQRLLAYARESILAHFKGDKPMPLSGMGPELSQNRGCFVTLKIKGSLRGCIGTFDIEKPLFENVERMSRAAAFQDSRFQPLTKSEASEIKISISVILPPFKVDDYQKLKIGKHGIIVKLGRKSGALLPEVGLEQGWSLDQFIMSCAREKAGLTPEECGRAEIYAYEVFRFCEKR